MHLCVRSYIYSPSVLVLFFRFSTVNYKGNEEMALIIVKLIMCQEPCYEMHLIYTDPFNPYNNDTEPETQRWVTVTVSYRARFWTHLVGPVLFCLSNDPTASATGCFIHLKHVDKPGRIFRICKLLKPDQSSNEQ